MFVRTSQRLTSAVFAPAYTPLDTRTLRARFLYTGDDALDVRRYDGDDRDQIGVCESSTSAALLVTEVCRPRVFEGLVDGLDLVTLSIGSIPLD